MAFDVFISYAYEDTALRDELITHLSVLRRQGIIHTWHDGNISPGTEREQQIREQLNQSQIILLLISVNYISSDFCYSSQMEQALARHDNNEARVIPILLRPTASWENAPFAKLQTLPTNNCPVTSWSSHDEAFTDVAKGIIKAIEDLNASSTSIPQSPSSIATIATETTSVPKISNIPFRKNLYFTGRTEELARMYTAFTTTKNSSPSQPLVISGLGGIGKTQTALEYAYRYQEAYDFIFWVKADTSEAFTSGLASIAPLLDLPVKNENDQMILLAAVKHWLQTHEHWLLILDNADDPKVSYQNLPSNLQGHVLLTSRTPAQGTEFQNLELLPMLDEEGNLFLLRRAKIVSLETPAQDIAQDMYDKAKAIVDQLGALPLALTQAASYIEKTKCSLPRYLELYHKRKTRLLQEQSGLTLDHPDPVATTWSLSFENIEQANPTAADLLRLCSFLDPDAIPEEFLTQGAEELGPTLQVIRDDPFALDDTIIELLKYSLIRRNLDTETLTIHRLVQDVLKESMDHSTQHQWAIRIVRSLNQAFPEVTFPVWQQCQRYLPHVIVGAALITQWQMDFLEAVTLLRKAGTYVRERGQYIDAEQLLEQALNLFQRVREKNALEQADVLNEIAELYRLQGKYTKALSYAQEALSIQERLLEPFHISITYSLNNLARLYFHQAKYSEAEPLYKRALSIREQVLGPDHPNTANSLGNLAGLYAARKYYTQAEPLYKRAFGICERILGQDHPTTLKVLTYYVRLLWDANSKNKAKKMQRELEKRQKNSAEANSSRIEVNEQEPSYEE